MIIHTNIDAFHTIIMHFATSYWLSLNYMFKNYFLLGWIHDDDQQKEPIERISWLVIPIKESKAMI